MQSSCADRAKIVDANSNLIPTLAMFTTYVTYTVIMKKELNSLFHFVVSFSRYSQVFYLSIQDILQYRSF